LQLSEGKFQFDLWGVTPSALWDWETLRKQVVEFGVRNSLLLAPMPTASTAQVGYQCCQNHYHNRGNHVFKSGQFLYICCEIGAVGVAGGKY
jgi:ribonucleoside-diphosphate reductase alpha chain